MGTKSIREFIVGLVSDHLCVDESTVTDNAHFIDQLGADSLDLIEMAFAIEDYYSIEIPDADAEKLRTLGGWVEYLERRDVKAVA